MLKVRDVMTRDVLTLPASLSVQEAAWALMHRGISGAPVRDSHGHLIGVISERDLINPERGALDDPMMAIEDIMTPALLSVDRDDPAVDAVEIMIAHHIHRVVVVDAAGDLVGIITPMDFLRHLAKHGHLEIDAGHTWPTVQADAIGHH
ncbi:MAG TPA: CBS domain-containing protein [Polyangia bacterium]|jgi:predicted transcriptional regulator|nr:CBS domain-containing protein [Polyangia bacterium]